MTLLMSRPIDTSDPMLVSDDERTVILTSVPRSDFWRCDYELPHANTYFPSDVRQLARKLRDAEMRSAVDRAGQVAA